MRYTLLLSAVLGMGCNAALRVIPEKKDVESPGDASSATIDPAVDTTDWHNKYHIICDRVHLPELYVFRPPFPPPSAGWKVCEIRKYDGDTVCNEVARLNYTTGIVTYPRPSL
jgi:hypothetical protein